MVTKKKSTKSKTTKKSSAGKRSSRKAAAGAPRNPLTPLSDDELLKALKPRPALKTAEGLQVRFDLMVAATRAPEVDVERPETSEARVVRYKGQAAAAAGPDDKRVARPFGVNVSIKATDLSTRVFPPSVKGQTVQFPRVTKAMTEAARNGLPKLDGFLPDHLPLSPVPPKVEESLRVRTFFQELPKNRAKTVHEATTIFSPDDRYIFSDTSFPWCTTGRVETAGGAGSGVLVGPRHLLTCSHVMVWNNDGSSGWVKFTPSYFDGPGPFGVAWATRWYAYKKVVGPGIDVDEGRQDYVVLVLNTRIGDVCGYMGSRTYSDSWDGGRYWRHIGYPGDLAAAQRPSYERDIALDGDFWEGESHQRIWHKGDVWPGQSGGPFFAWWSGESWPSVVCVQSGQNPSENSASGGGRMVDLIIRARNEFP